MLAGLRDGEDQGDIDRRGGREHFDQLVPDVHDLLLWNIRSCTVMTETSVEDFTTTVNWLTSEGAAVSIACGSTMRRKTWTCDMPTASAASRCARGTASIPVRKVSARYPLDCRASATQPAVKKVFGQPRISGQT